MSRIPHPVLGAAELDEDGCWETEIPFAGSPLRLAVWSEEAPLDAASLARVTGFVDELARFDALARTAMRRDYHAGDRGWVQRYLEYHLEELDEAERRECLGVGDPRAVDIDVLMDRIHLFSVALYPVDRDECAIFDYTIGEHVTQYMIVVKFDESVEVARVDMES